MSVTYIPESVKFRLWGKAGGRCQYEGCNEPLYIDHGLTQVEFNTAYIAHIIADKADGPRGDAVLSPLLGAEISNLMLMCDEHHRLIDKVDEEGHDPDQLRAMKEKHERRIELLTSIMDDKRSHVLLYGAKIGDQHSSPLTFKKAAIAMVPLNFPAENRGIELGLKNSSAKDHEPDFWDYEQKHLERQFHDNVRTRLATADVNHLSIFALAPIPLLVKLGALLSDIPTAEVYQLHREPADWKWQEHMPGVNDYLVKRPEEGRGVPVLVLELSATVVDSRISAVIDKEHSIWRLTLNTPGNDYLKSREQLSEFRKVFRSLLDTIKAVHGQATPIHVFPAVPVSVAVEIGRVWMPKADSSLVIYDQNNLTGGFSPALTIGNFNC